MDMFMSNLKQTTLDHNNVAFSDNGAKMYGSTGHALSDLNFSVSRMRDMDEGLIVEKFLAAFQEDPVLATKWLFYARDVREGLGERRLFNVIFKWMATERPMIYRRLVKYVSEYGRWDDLINLIGTDLERDAFRVIAKQFGKDLDDMKAGKSVSLLAKWIPSIATTSADSRRQALKISKYIGVSVPAYRKLVTKLRKYIDVLEVKMTARQWDAIDYSKVPSRANMLYAKAFLRHDQERREAFLDAALRGEVKMNSGMVYPHEIAHPFISDDYDPNEINGIEAMWKNLPAAPLGSRTIVVADGSGSMTRQVSRNSTVTCLDVAISLAIYFSQYLEGPYKDRFITFSENPQFVDLNGYDTLLDKVQKARQYTEIANTNIEKVFAMILETAVQSHLSQEELPDNILIISDMEFDTCVCGNAINSRPNQLSPWGGWSRGYNQLTPNLFESIAGMYAAQGYKIPRVCFWNTYGGSGAIPMIQNDLGVALMSGFSINNAKLIMSGKMDPYEALLDVLNSDRYADIFPAQCLDDCKAE